MARQRPSTEEVPLDDVHALYRAFLYRAGISDPAITIPPETLTADASPDDLGTLFVRRLHQKSHSAYYTPPRIATYLARNTLSQLAPIDGTTLADCEHLLLDVLPALRIVDPACGAGDLLIATFRALFELHLRLFERARSLGSQVPPRDRSELARHIATRNLFGTDLMPDAIEVARLRLTLEVAAHLPRGSTLPPLTFQLRTGNALIGLLDTADDPDTTLLERFRSLGIAYEHLTWDATKRAEGRVRKRPLTPADLAALRPINWASVFGPEKFDAVIANPPWDIFKPNAREFFERYSDLVTKRRMSMEDFDATRAELLEDEEIRNAWLDYVSSYRHVSAWYRSAPQFEHQLSLVNGRRAGTDLNLYKLFTEQSFNLLRPGGVAGLVLPSGIYTDLGARRLRELLFDETTITGLIGFENRELFFEDVHRSFKFVVLSFRKHAHTESFPAVFMRHSLDELDRFPSDAVTMRTDLVRQLAPDSLSLMEFRTSRDVEIASKLIRHPLLGNRLKLTSEFHMTADRKLFRTTPGEGRLPLFEGKMIWQFRSDYASPRYWIDEAEGLESSGAKVGFDEHRLAIRAIAANTNERTLIATLLPKRVFCGNSLLIASVPQPEALYYTAILNSFVMDCFLRSKVTTNINIFYLQQLPIPHFDPNASGCQELIRLAAQLVSRSPDFESLRPWAGVNTIADESALRAQLDAIVARLYGLEAHEFEHLLTAFPLVLQTIRNAALGAFMKS